MTITKFQIKMAICQEWVVKPRSKSIKHRKGMFPGILSETAEPILIRRLFLRIVQCDHALYEKFPITFGNLLPREDRVYGQIKIKKG